MRGTHNGSPFLELVNLCGLGLLIPEVNSSRKLDHKSFIDRSQTEECTIESKYLDMCSLRPSQSAFLYNGTILWICLLIVTLILPSTNTSSWSLKPGMTFRVLMIRLSLLDINKSKTFLPQVGLVTSWTKPWSCASSQIRKVHASYYLDNYVRYCHQSVGVISQSFLSLWHLPHPGYKRHKHTRSSTHYVDLNPEDFTLSFYSRFSATYQVTWSSNK